MATKVDETVIQYRDADGNEQRVYRRDWDDDFASVSGHPDGVDVPDDGTDVPDDAAPAE